MEFLYPRNYLKENRRAPARFVIHIHLNQTMISICLNLNVVRSVIYNGLKDAKIDGNKDGDLIMAESNILEIVQGLAQAAANAYDGSHDERFVRDGEVKKIGLKREEGCPITDQRVNDGFSVKFMGNQIVIHYQSDIRLKEIYGGDFENEMSRVLNEIKKFLQKEYKAITGNSITLTKEGDVSVLASSVSRVRSFVQAYQHFNISGIKVDPDAGGSENRKIEDSWRKFMDLDNNNKRPRNDTRKK